MQPDPGQLAAVSSLVRDLGLPSSVLSRLISHAIAVRVDADRLGLVSPADRDSILSRHTADSLLFALAREPGPGESWVDVGSGPGFPGIVLACCYPDTQFTLLEPQSRRAGFLELQCARLGLENVAVGVQKASDLEETFDVAVARALAEPTIAIETLRHLAPEGTTLLAVGATATAPSGVEEVRLDRPGVDSPGRIFMIARAPGGA